MSKKMEKLISREVFYVDTLHVAKYEKIMARICVSDVRNISFLLIKLSTSVDTNQLWSKLLLKNALCYKFRVFLKNNP